MPSSVEKIGELVAEYTGPPPPEAGPAELAIRSLMLMGVVGPEMLPSDPQDLDGLLDYLAAQCLRRRSDDAERPAMVYEVLGLAVDPPDAIVVE